MVAGLDAVDFRLANDWQRGFPLLPRPFAEIGRRMEISEDDVLARLQRLTDAGRISRVGATCRPNTVGASTLAAIAAPESRIEDIAEIIGEEAGINHSYQRENDWTIWFVATGPDRADVGATLDRVRARTGLRVLDLPLVRAFNVDLGFSLDGSDDGPPAHRSADTSVIQPRDRAIIQAMSSGLPLVPRPFNALAETLGRREDEVIGRIAVLADAGIFSRIGVIVRHRALGWTSNAMVVWTVPEGEIDRVGPALAALRGVTLCYQRRSVPVLWPYTLYCMVHACSRAEAMEVLDRTRRIEPLGQVPRDVLFSTRCFKQTGALIHRTPSVAA